MPGLQGRILGRGREWDESLIFGVFQTYYYVMATVKVKFRASTVAGRMGHLFYQVVHDGRIERMRTGFRLFPSEWDAGRGCCRTESAADSERREYLADVQRQIRSDLERFQRMLSTFGQDVTGCGREPLSAALGSPQSDMLFDFMQRLILQLRELNRMCTSETYTAALRSFARFRHQQDIPLAAIDGDLIEAYEADLRRSGVSRNTSSFYMRILRAVYNRAVEKNLTPQRYPFRHVYTGVDKTVKRAITLESLRRLRMLDLRSDSHLDYARDLFLLSFYLRGMSFVDMAYLKRSNLQDGVLVYRRQKTGQLLRIRWEPCMQTIVDKYPLRRPDYLLPVFRSGFPDGRNQYKNRGHLINRNLKRLGNLLNLPIPLTLYCARHTWASVARSREIPLSVISEGMGHDSETATRIYLASLDTGVVDRANRLVIDLLEI